MQESDVDTILEFKKSKGKTALPASIKTVKGTKAWTANKDVEIDFALPCATQNEIDEADALAVRICHSFFFSISGLVVGKRM